MIPLIDLQAQYRGIQDEIKVALDKVLDSSQYILGKAVADFEAAFADYAGTARGVAVNSGTSALHMALLAAGVGPGDEVITVPNTFVATVAAILYTGAQAVLVDVDAETLTMDPSKLEAAITVRTKAILPVHLYGHPADMAPIVEVARSHKLAVIEDAAQAHGAEYQGRRIGSIGDFGCFSFYPSKNLGAYGEGGMVTTNDAEAAQRLRMLRDWGQSQKYHHDLLAFNARMDGFQGAVLGVKLPHLEDWTEARRAHAQSYGELLADSGLKLPVERPNCRHVYYVYVVRTPQRDALQQHLGAQEIHTGIHYPHPVHLEKGYARLGYGEGAFPVAELACRQVLSIPLYPELTEQQIETVAQAIKDFGANSHA